MFINLKFIFTESIFFNTVDSCYFENTVIGACKLLVAVLQIYRLLLVRFVEQNNPNFLTTKELRQATHFNFINVTLTKEISALLLLLLLATSEMELLMTTTATSITEELAENIIKATIEVVTTMTTTLTLLLLETFLTILVIDFLLLRVFEDFVSFDNFLELLLSLFRIIFILIRMVFQGEFLECSLNFLFIGSSLQT